MIHFMYILPDYGIPQRDILGLIVSGFGIHGRRVQRYWYSEHDIGSGEFIAEIALIETVLETCVVPSSLTVAITRSASFTFDVALYLNGQGIQMQSHKIDGRCSPHRFRWNEADGSIGIKFIKADILVESTSSSTPSLPPAPRSFFGRRHPLGVWSPVMTI